MEPVNHSKEWDKGFEDDSLYKHIISYWGSSGKTRAVIFIPNFKEE